MQSRFVVLSSLLLLSGCTVMREMTHEESEPGVTTPAANPAQGRYEAVIGQGADAIAELRAAPAPEVPEVSDGKNAAGDEQRLGGQGFLRIGNGYYPVNSAETRDNALRQGQRVGADKILLYAADVAVSNSADNGSSVAALTAAYYIRFKPPFGASFRDLNATERQTLGVNGGVNIGAIIGGTPAAAANLRAGDAVITLDGKPIQNKATFQEMLRANAGKRVTLGISRDGVLISRIVRVGLLPLPAHKH